MRKYIPDERSMWAIFAFLLAVSLSLGPAQAKGQSHAQLKNAKPQKAAAKKTAQKNHSQKNQSPRKRAFERDVKVHVVYRKSGMRVLTQTVRTRINLPAALHHLGQARITGNLFYDDLEIIEAATIKANGERRDVPRDKIVRMTGTQRAAALIDGDRVTFVIPFPDLAVGDSTIVKYARKAKKQQMPGFVSFRWMFSTSPFLNATELTIDAPDSLDLRFAERGVVRDSSVIPGGRRYRWNVKGGTVTKRERLSVSWVDYAPRVLVSNMKSWSQFTNMYRDLIEHQSIPDEIIKAKAEEITRGITDRESIARALFTWTTRNIRYFRVVLGRGGLVPVQCRSVLKNGYGDCKDHANLLKALLMAKGIDSELVLINLARVYDHYPLPIGGFDHMILYIPEFKRYLDATEPLSSFDDPPLGLQGKPVVRITKEGAVLSRVAVRPAKQSRMTFTADLMLTKDGAITGQSRVQANGPVEQLLRRDAKRIEALGPVAAAAKFLRQQGLSGKGRIDAPGPLALISPFVIKTAFNLKREGQFSTPFSIPAGPKIYSPPVNSLSQGIGQRWSRAFVCTPLTYIENITISWPAGMALRKVPSVVRAVSDFARYRAIYRKKGNSLVVQRHFVIDPPHVPCLPRHLALATRIFSAIRYDRRQRIAFTGLQKFDDAFDDPPTSNGN